MKHSPAFMALVDQVRPHITESDVEGLGARLRQAEPFALIDVREEPEYLAGHIPGAEWIGKGILERDIEARHPEKSEEIWLYCGGGYRSALSAENLQRMGYTNVVSVDGGYRGWLDAGRPIETPETEL